ncbi:MAG TPA: PIG-L family deacetylase [Kiritimatiellia bacterium]|nr:PIG-L family deacetylase [Kiritimatiellia bacterium]
MNGPVVITVPHMDDEVIGCGALLASIENRKNVHFFFCGDGLGSFTARFIKSFGREKLCALRKNEARAALSALGYDAPNIHFADLPEWKFHQQSDELKRKLENWLGKLNPSCVFTPFRMDCHQDHVTLSRLTRGWADRNNQVRSFEYFVYYRLRLLPQGDMRKQIDPSCLYEMDVAPFVQAKRNALLAYTSQASMFDPAWTKPVLSEAFIEDTAGGAEQFFALSDLRGTEKWLNQPVRTQLVHYFEPKMKKFKDLALRALHH